MLSVSKHKSRKIALLNGMKKSNIEPISFLWLLSDKAGWGVAISSISAKASLQISLSLPPFTCTKNALLIYSVSKGAEISQNVHRIAELISRIKGLLQNASSTPLQVTPVCAGSFQIFVEAKVALTSK